MLSKVPARGGLKPAAIDVLALRMPSKTPKGWHDLRLDRPRFQSGHPCCGFAPSGLAFWDESAFYNHAAPSGLAEA